MSSPTSAASTRSSALITVSGRSADSGTPETPSDQISVAVDAGSTERLRGISLQLRAGEIVGLAGLQGSGRSSLARAIAGIAPFTGGRLSIAAVCAGVAERLIRDSLAYAMERKQFGRPIADFQLVQAMLADSQTEAYAARSMVLDAARRRDEGELVTLEASCCKLYASEMVGRVADRAVQIHGGAGYIADYGVERFYRDVRLFRLYEGTSQIQQLIIARQMIEKAKG